MIDYEKHFQKLQHALGIKDASGKNCVDKIDVTREQLWRDEVMKTLNEISSESAEELQKETGKPYPKDSYLKDSNGNIIGVKSVEELQKVTGKLNPTDSLIKDSNGNIIGVRQNQKYSEAPPTRLLSMTLNLSYWLGFVDASEDHELHADAIGAWERIEKAYKSGKAAHPKSKSNQSNAKTVGSS